MILAAGLTPAWQQIMLFDSFELGEVNRAKSVRWCGSGKVLNVGMALQHLGAESRTLSLLGGSAYDAIEQEFAQLNVSRHWIRTSSPTRVCTTLLERTSGATTELVENAQAVTAEELSRFKAAYSEEVIGAKVAVLAGSLPEGTPVTFYRELLEETACPAVLDFRGPELLSALAMRPFLVKPNREELGKTVGRELTDSALCGAMLEINDRGAEWVVVTQGKDAVWATSGKKIYRFAVPAVSLIANPIACGDCFAAGVAYGTAEGKNPIDAIKLGIGAAVDNLADVLPGRLNPSRVVAIAEAITVEQRS